MSWLVFILRYSFFIISLFLCIWIFWYIYLCAPSVCLVPSRSGKRYQIPWNWSYGCSCWLWCWESNLWFLEEHPVLLTAKPALPWNSLVLHVVVGFVLVWLVRLGLGKEFFLGKYLTNKICSKLFHIFLTFRDADDKSDVILIFFSLSVFLL